MTKPGAHDVQSVCVGVPVISTEAADVPQKSGAHDNQSVCVGVPLISDQAPEIAHMSTDLDISGKYVLYIKNWF